VRDWEESNFLCVACGRCWHVELSYVHRVDPITCIGCVQRQECLARFSEDATHVAR
jgi:ribosomal protein S27E